MADRYRLRALLGRGGMGRVWLAEDELLHRPVAPLSGRTLAELITVEGGLSIAQVTCIGLSLLDVLMAAHRAGILHCDVKPANVHLCDDGRVVLTDFGIACRMLDEASDCTRLLAGSPLYTAPERLRGGNPEPASDMFALGATLFTALEGKPPFSNGRSLFDTVVAVVESVPAPCLHAGLLRPVIEGLLDKNPQTGSAGRKRARLSLTSSTSWGLALQPKSWRASTRE